MINIPFHKITFFSKAIILKLFILTVLQLIVLKTFSQNVSGSGIIPKPVGEIRKEGFFIIKASTKLFFSDNQQISLSFFNQYFKDISEFLLSKSSIEQVNGINFIIDSTLKIKAEGYILDISSKRIDIKSPDERGLFYGLQSLTQLIKRTEEQYRFLHTIFLMNLVLIIEECILMLPEICLALLQ
ncbi:glycoside hydrolase family 20 zincin-like fold domain-containing protein [Pedobacter mendelii]|uniref:glycoside hydrolase family 20 zincin-like fold domain-containing protein n=1 Tax=Pedobacter mendelii TaxID=1908240 RepID=UPI0036329AC1